MELEQILLNIVQENQRIKEITKEISLSTYPSELYYSGKVVFEDPETHRIIRLEKKSGYDLRHVLVLQSFYFQVSDIFEEEVLIESTDVFDKTSQRKLLPWDYDKDQKELPIPSVLLYGDSKDSCVLSKRLYSDYPEIYSKICNFFDIFRLRFITKDNAGEDPETHKLKLFDWSGDYWVDSQGGIICSRLQ